MFATVRRRSLAYVFLLVLPFALEACAVDHGSIDNPRQGYRCGTVVRVADGDAFTILTSEKRQVKIRLAE